MRLEAYENSRIYKKKVQQFHDNKILGKEIGVSQKVLLFNSRLKLIADKLHPRWDKPFVITNIFPYGEIELRDEANNRNFKVNGHQIKPYHESLTPMVGEVENISLMEPALLKTHCEEISPSPYDIGPLGDVKVKVLTQEREEHWLNKRICHALAYVEVDVKDDNSKVETTYETTTRVTCYE
ncbi:hypothetical protein CR513_32750, partial [Mucuna pruriens]